MQPRGAADWTLYCDRRLRWKGKINRAGSHSRMREAAGVTFVVEFAARDVLQVRSCEEMLVTHDNIKPILSRAAARKCYVDYLAQGIDFATFNPAKRQVVEMMFDAMIGLQGQLDLVDDQMGKLRRRINDFLMQELT